MEALARAVAQAEAASTLETACASIRPLMADIGWLEGMIDKQCRAMACDPLHLPPLRASLSGPMRHLVLARTERIWVTVTILDPEAALSSTPRQVHFSGRLTLCRILGRVPLVVRSYRLNGAQMIATGEQVHHPGAMAELDERTEGWRIVSGERPVMLLRAQIAPPGPGLAPVLASVHDEASGARLSTSSGDEGHARALMMLSLLRAQKRTDAAPLFEEATDAALPHQRWAAMREYLALDTARALPALEAMAAGDADAEVRALARATLGQAVGAAPCPG